MIRVVSVLKLFHWSDLCDEQVPFPSYLGHIFTLSKNLIVLFPSFRALEHLEQAVQLQEEVLDTHEELIFTHQAMAIVLKELGRDEDANRENERAGECAKKLDPLEVPLNTIQTHEEKGWEVTDPVPIGST